MWQIFFVVQIFCCIKPINIWSWILNNTSTEMDSLCLIFQFAGGGLYTSVCSMTLELRFCSNSVGLAIKAFFLLISTSLCISCGKITFKQILKFYHELWKHSCATPRKNKERNTHTTRMYHLYLTSSFSWLSSDDPLCASPPKQSKNSAQMLHPTVQSPFLLQYLLHRPNLGLLGSCINGAYA